MKIGDRVKIIGNTFGHSYILGETYEISYVNHGNKSVTLKKTDGTVGNNAGFVDVELIYDRNGLEKNIKNIKRELRILRKKLDFMIKTSSDELDEEDFKISYIIELSEDKNLSIKDKSKRIKNILDNTFNIFDDNDDNDDNVDNGF